MRRHDAAGTIACVLEHVGEWVGQAKQKPKNPPGEVHTKKKKDIEFISPNSVCKGARAVSKCWAVISGGRFSVYQRSPCEARVLTMVR